MDTEKLKRRLNRLKEQRDTLQKEHTGNELKYTYWGGYNLGYLKGRICEIEDILDEGEDKVCLMPGCNNLATDDSFCEGHKTKLPI